jgi:myo-inositol-1(or 4)-monophosphatase
VVEVDLAQVIAIVREAGALAMESWEHGKEVPDIWEKSPGQWVSEADLAVNVLLRERLHALLPAAGWLSEETVEPGAADAKDLAWVVDPIDGTKDFVDGKPGWCVSVALISDGVPILGVLDAPAFGECWSALAGGGAWVNDRALTASSRTEYAGSRLPVDALPPGSGLVTVGKLNSIALRMAMVADDRADLVASTRWGSEWDIAAAHVIAAEAGARVTDAYGKDLRYNGSTGQAYGVLCCSAGIHSHAVEVLRRYTEASAAG